MSFGSNRVNGKRGREVDQCHHVIWELGSLNCICYKPCCAGGDRVNFSATVHAMMGGVPFCIHGISSPASAHLKCARNVLQCPDDLMDVWSFLPLPAAD